MKTRISRITLIALLALLLSGAETAILTLSCDGTVTKSIWDSDNGISKEREPVANMSLVADFAGGTVTGFLHPARITKVDAHYVRFSGSTHGELAVLNGTWSVNGSINRVTGGVVADTIRLHPTIPSKLSHLEEWVLLCKPTKRVLTSRMDPLPRPLPSWNIYVLRATPAKFVGIVDAADADEAIKKAVEELDIKVDPSG